MSWSALADDGGSAVATYTVTSSPDEATVVVAAINLTAVVTGLTNGTSYTFTVTATNAVGAGDSSAPSNAVVPATVPGTPTGAAATAGDGQATVTWSAPTSDGGRPVTGYTVTSSPGGITATSSASSLTAVVTGLANGTPYTFAVTATNEVGAGGPSAASNVVTPIGPPDAPTDVAAAGGDGQATVDWSAPAFDGGSPITGYIVTSNPDGTTAGVAASSLSAVVAGLANGTSYAFTVTATNAAGVGDPSAPSNAVTPATGPDAPTNVVAVAGDGQATVTWSAPALAWTKGPPLACSSPLS